MSTALATIERKGDAAQFLALFSRLCVGLREAQDDSGITQRVYWDALRDVPMAALEAGALALMREPGRKWFPTTAEWRTAAGYAHEQQLRAAVQPAREQPWTHECRDCEDSGWVLGLSCPGDTTCGRTKPHLPHTYTVACPCRATNRTYRRHQAFGGGAA